jgi:NADH-quinone oxidoreductase subunit M
MMPILSILLILPLLTTLFICFAPPTISRTLAVLGALATFALSLVLLLLPAVSSATGFRFEESYAWIPGLNIGYHLGVDGPAILLILLTTFLQLMVVLYSSANTPTNPRAFFALLMSLETAMIGSFCALDLVLFYVFFEACLVPTYFLIGIWGGRRRIAAATKFFVYTVVGSLLMLASIIALNLLTGAHNFDFVTLRTAIATNPFSREVGIWLFSGFAISFAVKAGVFPFHTWLPDTYAESPTAATVLLSGVLAKLGTYGFYRFGIQLFPDAAHYLAPVMVTLGVVSIIYGALIAAVQSDIKRVFAYSSISHLGFVTLGLFAFTPTALEGAFLQMVNHGITSGALFLIAGMIYARRGTTSIRQLGGLWEQMPVFGRLFLIATLSSIALPLTNGFVGEFLILIGSFQSFPWATALATTGVIWSAVYMLYMFQRVMYGPVDKALNRRLTDITGAERGLLAVFVVLIFALGIYPTLATRSLDSAVAQTIQGTGTPVALRYSVHGIIK